MLELEAAESTHSELKELKLKEEKLRPVSEGRVDVRQGPLLDHENRNQLGSGSGRPGFTTTLDILF